MAITFSCNHCGKSLTTSDDKTGRKAKCPGCGEVLTVPETEHAATDDLPEDDGDRDLDLDAGDLPDAPPPIRKKSSSAGTGTKTCPMCGAETPRRARWRLRRVNRMAGLCSLMYSQQWTAYWNPLAT